MNVYKLNNLRHFQVLLLLHGTIETSMVHVVQIYALKHMVEGRKIINTAVHVKPVGFNRLSQKSFRL